MTRSAVARNVSNPPKAEQYTWSFPGSLTVKLNLRMVSRLQSKLGHIQEGLLIGNGTGVATEVEDFRSLSGDQAAKLLAGPRSPASEQDPSVVGYFRVMRDGELRLSAEDLA